MTFRCPSISRAADSWCCPESESKQGNSIAGHRPAPSRTTNQRIRSMFLFLSVLANAALGCATMPGAPPIPAPPSSAAAGNSTIVAIAPPAKAPCTIWDFLGVTGLCKAAGAAVGCEINKLGSFFPGLEPGPPLLAITDPANAKSSNPAVAAAAAAKADEDAAPQKIKALRYLATLGCGGCYPDIEAALLAGLDDCTESVRYEAAKALSETSRIQCRYCDSSRCCSKKVREKLHNIAYKLNESGCHIEPSARVRRVARVALMNCGCDDCEFPDQVPEEGPTLEASGTMRSTPTN